MNKNFFKEYELTYKAYIVLPSNIPINYVLSDDLCSIITKELERTNKCIVASLGITLRKTDHE